MACLLRFDEAAALGMQAVRLGGAPPDGFGAVTADSRQVSRGGLFVALSGERTDGHLYVRQALEGGAAGIVVEREKLAAARAAAQGLFEGGGGAVMLAADNTLYALQALARLYLSKFPRLLKIGITGSSGKTTTKEIAAAIFSCEKKIVYNAGNLNSDVGLPLSVFNVQKNDYAGIFEMGMNRKGEIAELASVLHPDKALITNTGSAHIGIIGSLENIALEKKAIFSAFTGSETAFIPQGKPYTNFLARDVNGNVVLYDTQPCTGDGGSGGDDGGSGNGSRTIRVSENGIYGSDIHWNGYTAHYALPGTHNVENALAAMALAKDCGIADESIVRGLESVKPLFGRAEIVRGRCTVVRDCYNANPDSVERALDLCDTAWDGRRLYVIGEMLELGAESAACHRALGERLAASKADFVFLFGGETAETLAVMRQRGKDAYHTDDIDALISTVRRVVHDGDLLLLKGSRGCALERVEEGLSDVL